MAIEERPEPVIDGGLIDTTVTPDGSPLALRATAPVNPFIAVTVAVYVVPVP